MRTRDKMTSIAILMVFMLPTALVMMPVSAQSDSAEQGWWVETTVDRDRDGIGDMVAVGLATPGWVGEDGMIGVIIDFDHLPTTEDRRMLEFTVGFVHSWDLPLIHALAGSIPVESVVDASILPGVVMIELDGMLGVTMDHVKESHGINQIWADTGYTGAGTTVAIIDTGIDSNHSGLDDLDDDNTTNDPKVIAFYDAVNAPGDVNGTEQPAYDDQGHGSHCAGITAGTGAPDYEFVGVAPLARLVGVKVLDSGGSGSFATVMGGMQWTVDNRYKFNIRAASMSLGGFGLIEWTSSEEDSVNRYANEMMRAGITLFIAAGNSAVSAQIGTPGSAEDVVTVGALDKGSSPGQDPIAPYSSQGPTEEGRVKPNLAFIGSDVMSVAANSGDGYTGMSGTSMATPGAAGLGALMLQANPDLSPFDVRNIMQETATYRQCHYMLANEPCLEDGLPKNRQNNVYGHGHVNGMPALMEAANRSYGLNTEINISIGTEIGDGNRIHLGMGEAITIELSETVDSVQWRSNHLRDDWVNLHSYEHTTVLTLSHTDIVHNLEHLPGIELEGNQTISIRAIKGEEASTNMVVDIMIHGTEKMEGEVAASGISGTVMLLSGVVLGILCALGMFGALKLANRESTHVTFVLDAEADD